jgi:hypothetical protein
MRISHLCGPIGIAVASRDGFIRNSSLKNLPRSSPWNYDIITGWAMIGPDAEKPAKRLALELSFALFSLS